MKQYTNVSYGGYEPQAVEYATDATIVNQGIYSQEEEDEQGEQQTIWYVATQYHYTPQEYISYLETKLAQERADNDELLIDLDERVTAMEG